MVTTCTWIGIDVSKSGLVVASSGNQRVWSVANSDAGRGDLVRRLGTFSTSHVVLEATGQWHIALCDALANADIPYTQVDGYKMRNFVRSQGRRAKTDAIDARMLASYGATVQPEATAPRPPQVRALAALVARREDLVSARVREKNRLKSGTSASVLASCYRITRILTTEIKTIERQIADLIASDPDLTARYTLLRSVPGWGTVTVTTVLALLPELGTLSRKRLNALVGIAPYNQESGSSSSSKQIAGGRAVVRRALYMAIQSAANVSRHPVIRGYFQSLTNRGKPYKVAMVATMNHVLGIVNAMVRDNVHWEETAASRGIGTLPSTVIP